MIGMQQIPTFGYQSNCYLVFSGKQAALIDASASVYDIDQILRANDLCLTNVILTHGHFDHIANLPAICAAFAPQVAIGAPDAPMLDAGNEHGLARLFGQTFSGVRPDLLLGDGDTLPLGDDVLKIAAAPGHTPGGILIEAGPYLFTGDTLFQSSVGRVDFPASNPVQMKQTLARIKRAFAESLEIFPGHGAKSILAIEKKTNPYLNDSISYDDFFG